MRAMILPHGTGVSKFVLNLAPRPGTQPLVSAGTSAGAIGGCAAADDFNSLKRPV